MLEKENKLILCPREIGEYYHPVIESLSETELKAFFYRTIDDFPLFKDKEFCNNYAHKLSTNAVFVVIRGKDNNIVALMAVYYNNPPLCYISHISVIPEYKRKGMFRMMLSMLERKALDAQCTYIRLEVRRDNIPAISAYTNSGFIIEEIRKESMYMQKLLISPNVSL